MFHIGCSLNARSASARASREAPSSAPVTSGSPSAPTSTIVVSASRLCTASAAAPGVRPPTGTPATEVPGAISTSEDATRATTAMPAGMPSHSARCRLRGAGSGGAHSSFGASPSPSTGLRHPVAWAVAASSIGASSAPGLVARSVMPSPPGCQHVDSMVRDGRPGPGNGSITDAATASVGGARLRRRRPPGRPRSSRWNSSPSCGEVVDLRHVALSRPPSMTSATSANMSCSDGHERGDLVVRDLRRGVRRAPPRPSCIASTAAAGSALEAFSNSSVASSMLCLMSAHASACRLALVARLVRAPGCAGRVRPGGGARACGQAEQGDHGDGRGRDSVGHALQPRRGILAAAFRQGRVAALPRPSISNVTVL